MKLYAGRFVILLTGFMALLSASMLGAFFAFHEIISSQSWVIDSALVLFVGLILLSQLMVLYNFLKFPTLALESGKIKFQRFPFGQYEITKGEIQSVNKRWLGLSQVLEFKFKYKGKSKTAVITAPVEQQESILRELGIA